jgi:hypothetical protein
MQTETLDIAEISVRTAGPSKVTHHKRFDATSGESAVDRPGQSVVDAGLLSDLPQIEAQSQSKSP